MKRIVFLCLLTTAVFGVSVLLFFTPKSQNVSVSLDLKDKTVRKTVVPVAPETFEKTKPSHEKEITSNEKEITSNEEINSFVKAQMTKEECAKLFALKMTDFETYVPEISTTGETVAAADLPMSEQGIVPADLPDLQKNAFPAIDSNVSFPVFLRLKKRYPYLKSNIKTGDIPLVFVSIKNGKAFINDVPVDSTDLKSMRQACQNAR